MDKILDSFYSVNNDDNQVFAEMLYGSQNYGLDTENSDVDTRVILIPTLEDLIKNKKVSKTVTIPNGLADIKDIREMFKQFKKANPAYLEILASNYGFVNKDYKQAFNTLRKNATKIATANKILLAYATYGMATSKLTAIINNSGSNKEAIKKYGYDGKNACHVLRLEEFLKRLLNGAELKDALNAKEYPNYEKIMDIKKHKLEKDEVLKLCKESVNRTKVFTDYKYEAAGEKIFQMLEDMSCNIIKEHIKKGFVN